MATWFPVSQLLLVSVLNWNALCFPSNFGRKSNLDSSKVAPVAPTDVNHPAVSYMHPIFGEQYHFSPETTVYSNYEYSPDTSSVASLNPVPLWGTVDSSYSKPRISEPTAVFKAGELKHREGNSEYGNSEWESEQLNAMLPESPPPYPEYGYQAGEMFHRESTFEHGHNEQEMEEQGLSKGRDFAPSMTTEEEGDDFLATILPEGMAQQPVNFRLYDQYYYFLSGQIPPGTLTHFSSDYGAGRDHWHEVHYKGFRFPAENQASPTQEYSLKQQPPALLKQF